ncbi:MAG: M23 family metallopeptidase [Alphaproteobacteria bacterium]
MSARDAHASNAAAAPSLPTISAAPSAAPVSQVSPALHQLAENAKAAILTPEPVVRAVELSRGDTLASLLADADLEASDAHEVLEAIGSVYNMRKLPRGLEVSMRFTRLGSEETFDGLTFQPEPTAEIRVARVDGAFKAEKIVTPVERQRFAVEGAIDSSLYEAGAAKGVPHSVMAAMIHAFSHTVDFQRDLQPGDKFRVLYDQPRTKSGQPAGDATIIYAALEVGGVAKAVYRVLYSDGTSEYFNDKGESVRRGLMRTPIDGARLSSSFGMRRHPILGYSKFHKGIDFAAPTGTPIFAAGDGVVQEVGFKNGYGRFILVRHTDGLATAYGHMSRFARGISRGSRVQQGDVIAYVGMTGRATGPHLHFEVRREGQPVNPLSVDMRARYALTGKQLTQFTSGKAMIDQEFKRQTLADAEKAAAKGREVQVASNNGRPKLGDN